MKNLGYLFVMVFVAFFVISAKSNVQPLSAVTPELELDEAFDAHFSPDGEWLAFTCDLVDEYGRKLEVCVMHPDGSGIRQLTSAETGQRYAANWSPDGEQLVISGSYDTSGLFTVEFATGEIQQIAVTPAEMMYYYGVWSPDGSQIAFICENYYHEFSDVCLLDLATGDITNLTQQFLGDWGYGHAWIDNETLLIFTDDEERGLYQLDLTTGEKTLVAEVCCYDPVVSGDEIICEGIFIFNPELEDYRALQSGSFPSVSPDGSLIAYTVDYIDVAIMNRNGVEVDCLTCEE